MARIITKSEATRRKFTFSCDGKLKDDYDDLRKQLEELGKKLDLTEDFEKVVKVGIAEMRKSISAELSEVKTPANTTEHA